MKSFALIIFTKVPIPGAIKTRLTIKEGGPLTAEEAAKFYEASLTDIIAASLNAIQSCRKEKPHHNYGLFIAYEPKDRKDEIMRLLGKLNLDDEALNQIRLFSTEGKSFNDRISMAFETVFSEGYEAAVIIGGDHPTIQPRVIREAFSSLEKLDGEFGKGAMIVGPCLEAGVYLVGLTRNARINFDGVFYNPQGITALEALTDKAIEKEIPFAILEMVPDVDIPSDLASLVVMLKSMQYAAKFQREILLPRHTIKTISDLHLVARAPPSQRELKTV